MAISTEVAGLAMSVVSGAVKLGRKLDEIMAEEEALRGPLAIPFPDVTLAPSFTKLRKTLKTLLRETQGQTPDPLGSDRASILTLLDGPSDNLSRDKLTQFCRKYGLIEKLGIKTFSPDAAFRQALLARNKLWNLSEPDIHKLTYYLAAGPDRRHNDLGFRIGATVLDVLAEVAGQNTRLIVDHEPTRKLVEVVLMRFSEPDLATMDGWGGILEHALRVTLNTVIDEHEAVAGNQEWLEQVLSAVARARELAPNGDDFVLGLLRGTGFNQLIRGALAQGAGYLSEADNQLWESILADVLVAAADKARGAPSFEAFFDENWHLLVSAGFTSIKEHGAKLLDEDDEILRVTLVASVGALADSFAAGPPTGQTLTTTVRAAISVFADPGVLAPAIRERWLTGMIASVATVVRDDGLRAVFTQPALESYARDALDVLSRYPEVLAQDNKLVRKIISNVLGGMSKVETFGVGPLADSAVAGALTAIAENPGLLDVKYTTVLGDLAGGLAERVANGGITSLQAETLVEVVADVLATNERLYIEAREGLARAVVDAVLDIAGEDETQLLAGAALVVVAERILDIVSTRGLNLPMAPASVKTRLKQVLKAGLSRATEELGHRLAQSDVPAVLAALVERLARGEGIPRVGTAAFETLFATLVEEAAARAA